MLYTWNELLPDQKDHYRRCERNVDTYIARSNNSFKGSNLGIKILNVKGSEQRICHDNLSKDQNNRLFTWYPKYRGGSGVIFSHSSSNLSEALILEYQIKKRGANSFLEDLSNSG